MFSSVLGLRRHSDFVGAARTWLCPFLH